MFELTQQRREFNCLQRADGGFPTAFCTEALYARILVCLKCRLKACVSTAFGEIFQFHIAPADNVYQAAEKDPYASLPLNRLAATYCKYACPAESRSIFRAPRLWIFLSSLQELFFIRLLEHIVYQQNCDHGARGLPILSAVRLRATASR